MAMTRAWREVDRILRGEATRTANLGRGTIEVEPRHLVPLLVVMAMSYGICMGCFAIFSPGKANYLQVFASMLKVPALFVLTLFVTLPSLYVFNALVGSRLTLASVIRLLSASLAIIVTLLASFGPIVAFFSVSTTSYSFMVLLNVVVFATAGAFGLLFLLQTLHRLSLVTPTPSVASSELVGLEKGVAPAGPLESVDDRVMSLHVKIVFRCWVVLFGVVGSQMSWVLRPFIGNPDRPFAWFRGRESNFFVAVWAAFTSLFS